MSGIEKVCEYSGEYASYDMYTYKRNHIQVIPAYRKQFANANYVLHVFFDGYEFENKRGWYRDYDPNDMYLYSPPFQSQKEYIKYVKEQDQYRLVKRYTFVLHVFDDHLQGEVNGRYMNSTYDLNSTKRRIKRMLKCESLNIINHIIPYHTWREDMNKV